WWRSALLVRHFLFGISVFCGWKTGAPLIPDMHDIHSAGAKKWLVCLAGWLVGIQAGANKNFYLENRQAGGKAFGQIGITIYLGRWMARQKKNEKKKGKRYGHILFVCGERYDFPSLELLSIMLLLMWIRSGNTLRL